MADKTKDQLKPVPRCVIEEKCCRGDKKYPHPGGYVWRYRKD